MNIDYTKLENTPRLLLEAKLKPLQGERFQPTGFADLGPARYTLPNGTEMLLVESAQSVANRMELACWDESSNTWIEELKGLPYVRVNREDGSELTNSVLEAHRINSEYIMNSADTTFRDKFTNEITYVAGSPVNWQNLHKTLFKYDPGSLIHGCFLEEIGGRLRVTRALSGFIEASDVTPAESGGVKNNRVEPELKGGEGNVPYHRTEFVAKNITSFFNLDLALLRGYGLEETAKKLLIGLSLFKIQHFLSTGLRLRTACDLCIDGGLIITQPTNGFQIPSESALLDECKKLVAECIKQKLFTDPAITPIKFKPGKKKKDKEQVQSVEEETDS